MEKTNAKAAYTKPTVIEFGSLVERTNVINFFEPDLSPDAFCTRHPHLC